MTSLGSGTAALRSHLDTYAASRDVLLTRMSPLMAESTLQVIGDAHGITRERVRQLQVKLTSLISTAADDPAVLAVAGAFRDRYGLAVEVGTVPVPSVAASMPDWPEDEAIALALFAVGWRRSRSWCLHPSVPVLPTTADEDQRHRLSAYLAPLLGAGLAEQIAEGAVEKGPNPAPLLGDTVQLILAAAHRPLRAEEIAAQDPGGRSTGSIRNLMAEDERFVRLGTKTFGLRSWGLPPYLPVADAIDAAIAAGNGRARLSDLQKDLPARFGHSSASVSIYASAALRFQVQGGWVRHRPPEDYASFAVDPEDDPHCFRDEKGRWATDLEVGADLLRGSGLGVPEGFAGAVACGPGETLTTTDQFGAPVTLTWSDRNTSGPGISSVRLVAEALGAVSGDRLRIAVDGDGTLAFSLVEQQGSAPGN